MATRNPATLPDIWSTMDAVTGSRHERFERLFRDHARANC
jgi:hypothetical protein